MHRVLRHIKLWNRWRKRSTNGWFYKLTVLFGRKSSSFKLFQYGEAILEGFKSGVSCKSSYDAVKLYLNSMYGDKNGRLYIIMGRHNGKKVFQDNLQKYLDQKYLYRDTFGVKNEKS